MKQYTFTFGGEIVVEAESEEEAYEIVDDLVAPTAYAGDNCINITVDNIECIDQTEDEEED